MKIPMLGIGILLFMLVLPFGVIAKAEEGMFPFSAVPILPENQDLTAKGYFKFNVKPNENKTIQVQLENTTNQPQNVSIDPVNALTTKNGGVNYTAEQKTQYTSFLDNSFAVSPWVKPETRDVTLKPYETKVITINLDVPNISKGVYLGGIMFSPEMKKEALPQNEKETASFEIYNHYGFVIAIEMNNQSEDKINPIEVGKTEIISTPSDVQLMVELKNQNANIVIEKNFHYWVYDEQNKLVFEGMEEEMKMAPKTIIQYPIAWKNELKEGKYHVKISFDGQNAEGKSVPFEIKDKQIEPYVTKDVSKENKVIVEKKVVPSWVWALIGCVCLISIIIGILIGRKKK